MPAKRPPLRALGTRLPAGSSLPKPSGKPVNRLFVPARESYPSIPLKLPSPFRPFPTNELPKLLPLQSGGGSWLHDDDTRWWKKGVIVPEKSPWRESKRDAIAKASNTTPVQDRSFPLHSSFSVWTETAGEAAGGGS
ncbi:hypothetical protein CDEST_11647 [Colletotrichum destructivum]|uniref:Uncharacterized protein n=1 Tax=Colletotrichum destructivum TaxID=34406 RepID=A0AAX4IU25_9PEZI|nr:hypothetical protein CDEST_11647 [Colletotrichum destructivum]